MEIKAADHIRFLRKQKGLTQEQLAEAVGVSVAAVSKWEQGQSLPEIPMLIELADFFDCSVDALLGYALRANDRESVGERLKMLRRTEKIDEGVAEAEKALKKYPNTFSVVYESAMTFDFAGMKRKDKAMLRRALDLLSHAGRLLPQNTDPAISELSIKLCMADILLEMEEFDRALAALKANNACGFLDGQIGHLLAGIRERREESVSYLSMALLRGLTTLIRVGCGFASVYEARGDTRSALDILQWLLTMLTGLKKPGRIGELDKISAILIAARAQLFYSSGDMDAAREELARAKALAADYDAAPSHKAANVRFFEGAETVNIYSELGSSAMEAAHQTFMGDEGTERQETFWQGVARPA